MTFSVSLIVGQRSGDGELKAVSLPTASRGEGEGEEEEEGAEGGGMELARAPPSQSQSRMKLLMRDELLINVQKFATQVHVCMYVCVLWWTAIVANPEPQ